VKLIEEEEVPKVRRARRLRIQVPALSMCAEESEVVYAQPCPPSTRSTVQLFLYFLAPCGTMQLCRKSYTGREVICMSYTRSSEYYLLVLSWINLPTCLQWNKIGRRLIIYTHTPTSLNDVAVCTPCKSKAFCPMAPSPHHRPQNQHHWRSHYSKWQIHIVGPRGRT
jgi:hypothetical protein